MCNEVDMGCCFSRAFLCVCAPTQRLLLFARAQIGQFDNSMLLLLPVSLARVGGAGVPGEANGGHLRCFLVKCDCADSRVIFAVMIECAFVRCCLARAGPMMTMLLLLRALFRICIAVVLRSDEGVCP